MSAVDVEGLTVTYGKVTAVDDLSFQAESGDVTCMLGPNGAGKTSTIETLEGLRRPAAGRVSVVGLNPQTEHFVLTERMGVMLQEGGIHPGVTVRAALRHAHALYDNPLDVRGLIDRLGLDGLERRTYRQLSGGEQKRLALALALIGRPQVAFLDEPTSGVDPAGRQVIRRVIADLRNEGVTVLLTTHDLDEAERVADRVVIIDRGRLLAEGTVAELTRTPDDESRVSFRAPPGIDRAAMGDHVGADVTETAPGDYTVAAPPTPPVIAAITAWLAEHDLPLGDLRAGRQRLEDVYLRLTSGEGPRPRRRRRAPTDPADGGRTSPVRPDDAGPFPPNADDPGRPTSADPFPHDDADGPARPTYAAGPDDADPFPADDREPYPPGGVDPDIDFGAGAPPARAPGRARARAKGRITQIAPRRRADAAPPTDDVRDDDRPAVEVLPPGPRSAAGVEVIPPAPRLGADPDADPTVEVLPSTADPDPDRSELEDAWFGAEPDEEERGRRTADWWSPPWSGAKADDDGGATRRFRRRS